MDGGVQEVVGVHQHVELHIRLGCLLLGDEFGDGFVDDLRVGARCLIDDADGSGVAVDLTVEHIVLGSELDVSDLAEIEDLAVVAFPDDEKDSKLHPYYWVCPKDITSKTYNIGEGIVGRVFKSNKQERIFDYKAGIDKPTDEVFGDLKISSLVCSIVNITAGTGIGVTANTSGSAITITNTGVRTVSTGSKNGSISVNTNGTSTDVFVAGLEEFQYGEISSAITGSTVDLVTDSAVKTYVDQQDSLK